jgi:rhodanese-related sulfurtransferase
METQTLVKEICPTTTQEWVKRGALLVDVRENDEVAELAYDVHNIVNIPLSEFEDHYTELPKEREMVIVCRGGGRSLRAAGFLINHGFDRDKVVNMQHGIIRWVQKGFPTKGDTSSVASKNESGSCCGTVTLQNNASGNSSKTSDKACC